MASRKLAVVVSGGRAKKDRALVRAALDGANPSVVLHDDNANVAEWCRERRVWQIAYPAADLAARSVAEAKRDGDMCGDLLTYRTDGYRVGVVTFDESPAIVNHAERRGIKVWHPASGEVPFTPARSAEAA